MRIELCKGDTMTAKEYEKALKDREKAWTNEEFSLMKKAADLAKGIVGTAANMI